MTTRKPKNQLNIEIVLNSLKTFLESNPKLSKKKVIAELNKTDKYPELKKAQSTIYSWLKKLKATHDGKNWSFNEPTAQDKFKKCARFIRKKIVRDVKTVYVPTFRGYSETFIYEIMNTIPEYRNVILKSMAFGTGALLFLDISSKENQTKIQEILEALDSMAPTKERHEFTAFLTPLSF